MILTTCILTAAFHVPADVPSPILAAVPDEAFSVVFCRDVDGMRQRLERNDWVKVHGSRAGEPLMEAAEEGFRSLTYTDLAPSLEIAMQLRASTALFQSETVWGLVTEPPTERTALAAAMRAWLPESVTAGDGQATGRTVDVLGARVELARWIGPTSDWNPREGHYAAFVDGPKMMGLFSGDDEESLLRTVRASIVGAGTDHTAPIVGGFVAAREGRNARGVEGYIDFSPFVPEMEANLKRQVEQVFPDPTALLGLEKGTWLYLAFDADAGSSVSLDGHLRVPEGTLAARLADTFAPLPHDLPGDIPKEAWSIFALQWDIHSMYRIAREAIEAKHGEDSLGTVDAGLDAAATISGVDAEKAILAQLAGTFAIFMAEDPSYQPENDLFAEFMQIGALIKIVDGDGFLDTLDTLMGAGGVESMFRSEEIDGADVWLVDEEDEDFDGGMAITPDWFLFGVRRAILTGTLGAVGGADGASLLAGNRAAGAFDENHGACYFSCTELRPLRDMVLFDARKPAPEEEAALWKSGDGAVKDPFVGQIVGTARRTKQGFDLRVYTR
ncbi:MAG: hypothetical protein GY711_02445 [bacterium]|nr:hypothetical protein [bacterium]